MSQLQNALIQSMLQQNFLEGPKKEENPGFSMVLDPEVRKRLNLENPRVPGKTRQAPAVQPMMAPMPATAPVGDQFSRSVSVSGPQDNSRTQDAYIQFKDLLAAQDQGIVEQQQMITDVKKRNNDARFNPAMVAAASLGDTIYGGNQAKDAQQWAGASPEERAKLVADMEGSLNDQRATMSNQVKSLISEQNNLRIADMASKNNRYAHGADQRLNLAFNRDVQAANKGAFETMSQIQPIEFALQPDATGMVDADRVSQALSNASRLMGERGVLTDNDIARVQRRTIDMEVAKIQSFLSSNTGQKVPAANVASLAAAIQDGKRAYQENIRKRLTGLRDSYVMGYGMRPEVGDTVINQVYGPMFEQSFQPTLPATGSAPAATGRMTRDEFMKQFGR